MKFQYDHIVIIQKRLSKIKAFEPISLCMELPCAAQFASFGKLNSTHLMKFQYDHCYRTKMIVEIKAFEPISLCMELPCAAQFASFGNSIQPIR
jgi:hypothetical protein